MSDVNNTFDPFDDEITFDTKPQEFPPYLGIIVRDERVNSVYNGEPQTQWVYAVRPVETTLGGKTGAWSGFIKWNTKANTTMMKLLPEFNRIFGKTNPETGDKYRLGHGDLIGLVAMFQNKSFSFGPKMSNSKPVPVPVGPATEEQIEKARALPAYVPQASADDSNEEPSPDFSEADLILAAQLYNGQTHKEVLKSVLVNKDDFSESFVQGIQSGLLLQAIVNNGLAEKTDNGVIRALVTA